MSFICHLLLFLLLRLELGLVGQPSSCHYYNIIIDSRCQLQHRRSRPKTNFGHFGGCGQCGDLDTFVVAFITVRMLRTFVLFHFRKNGNEVEKTTTNWKETAINHFNYSNAKRLLWNLWFRGTKRGQQLQRTKEVKKRFNYKQKKREISWEKKVFWMMFQHKGNEFRAPKTSSNSDFSPEFHRFEQLKDGRERKKID